MNLHKLERQLNSYESWLAAAKSDKQEVNALQYPGLWRLRHAIVEFWQEKSPKEWDEFEDSIAARIARVDWHYQAITSELSNSDLYRLALLPYTSQSVRLYMLTAVSKIDDTEMRRDAALYFFENDGSETIRDCALEVLSRSNWDRAENTALAYWNTGYSMKMMVALRVLKNIGSSRLKYLLKQAMDGLDPSVAYAAKALSLLGEEGDSNLKIFVDADACPQPVRDIVLRTASRLRIEAVFVANKLLSLPESPYIKFVLVEAGPDLADKYIQASAQKTDLVVSQDILLAHGLVKAGIVVINPRGDVYSEENISERISSRDLLQSLRDTGLITGGPSQYGEKQKRAFASALDRELTKLKKQRGKAPNP